MRRKLLVAVVLLGASAASAYGVYDSTISGETVATRVSHATQSDRSVPVVDSLGDLPTTLVPEPTTTEALASAPTPAPPSPPEAPPAQAASSPPPAPSSAPEPAPSIASRLVSLVNVDRAANGLAPLGWNGALTDAATAWSGQLAATASLAHQYLLGLAQNLGLRTVAENVYAGPADEATIEAAFMSSPAHRANILNPVLSHIGIGVTVDASGRAWVVQDFGAP